MKKNVKDNEWDKWRGDEKKIECKDKEEISMDEIVRRINKKEEDIIVDS